MTLHLGRFSGLIRAGSPDAQETSELLRADGLDVGPRGQLVAASAPTDYVSLKDLTNTAVWDQLYGLGHGIIGQTSRVIAVGNRLLQYQLAWFSREGSATPVPTAQVIALGAPHMLANPGIIATIVQMPGASGGLERIFVNAGAREGFYPNTAPGLHVLVFDLFPVAYPITGFMALGSVPANTKQLYFRGIAAYNGYLWGWGYDSADTTNRDGPCRIMFSGPGDGGSWGNDNQNSLPARDFTDSDAIILGGSGEIIRGALAWNGRLYVGTNQKLHFVAGYGRDTFLTDGSNPVSDSFSIVGAHALLEGPDRMLYGVAEKSGLWVLRSSGAPDPVGLKLVDFNGRSRGFWDCIWTDPSQVTDYPGKTNRDLVWTIADHDTQQVIVGIPWCNATTGYGYGLDTVVIKYHTHTGGFTRQVSAGVQYTAAEWTRAENQQREGRYMATATAGQLHIKRYAYQANQAAVPAMPSPLPDVEFGPFALFGPDGVGAIKRLYLTLAWIDATALPLKFTVTVTGDQATIDTFLLTIGAVAPVAPSANDIWLDTAQTDANLGNATAGVTIGARGGYLAKTFVRGAWESLCTGGGHGTRATVPLPIARTKAARVSFRFQCTSAAGRYQVEGLGTTPGGGKHGA